MDTKQFHRRTWGLVVLLALVLAPLGATLYDLQVNSGEKYYQQAQHKIAESEPVEAGRARFWTGTAGSWSPTGPSIR